MRNFVDEPFVGQLKISLPPLNAKTLSWMTEDQVNKLPPQMLNWLWRVASHVQDLDEITIVTVPDQSCHQKIQWLHEWIVQGENASFLGQGKQQVFRVDGPNKRQIASYDAKLHAHDTIWRATAETHDRFAEVVALYQFGTRNSLTDLQLALSKHLCSQYPVHVTQIVTFFKTLYTNDVSTTLDADLASFIAGRIEALRSIAVKDEDFVAFLRDSLPASDKFTALLTHLSSNPDGIEMATESLSDGMGKVNEGNALLTALVRKYLRISNPVPATPIAPAAHPNSDHHTGNAMVIFDAIYQDKRSVVAENHGRGNLRSTRLGPVLPEAQADEFHVTRGEILVLLSTSSSEGNKPQVVCNRHGIVGELSQYLKLIPLQEAYNADAIVKSGRPTPLSPASDNSKNTGPKRKRWDSYRPSV